MSELGSLFAWRERGGILSQGCAERTASGGDPFGVVLELKFPSRIIASKQSMTDRRRARRARSDFGEANEKSEICMCPRKARLSIAIGVPSFWRGSPPLERTFGGIDLGGNRTWSPDPKSSAINGGTGDLAVSNFSKASSAFSRISRATALSIGRVAVKLARKIAQYNSLNPEYWSVRSGARNRQPGRADAPPGA